MISCWWFQKLAASIFLCGGSDMSSPSIFSSHPSICVFFFICVFLLCLFVDLYSFVFVAWTGLCPPQLSSAAQVRKRQKAQKSRDQIHSQEKLRPDPFTRKKLRRDSIHSQDPSIASVLAQLWRCRSKNPIESKWKLQQSSYAMYIQFIRSLFYFLLKYGSRLRNINEMSMQVNLEMNPNHIWRSLTFQLLILFPIHLQHGTIAFTAI